ncbi:MAG TPA: c-type cytochrome [Candidatus Acidoferrales bacterium]|nr:c-type cytochrome [Candidatus Acidoferrales bacterium]
MKRDDRSLMGFSLGVTGVAVIAVILAARPSPLKARTPLPVARASHASVSGRVAQAAAPQTAQPGAQQTAGDKYMNVQVLKDIPADQLIPAMRYITAALGVECNYCHVPDHFDSDDKPHKLTARKMMTMMFAIDKDNFNGRREVTCYTCHRGASHPVGVPVLGEMASASAMNGTMGNGMGMREPSQSSANRPGAQTAPAVSVDAILAKYTDAIGGSTAIGKITSLDEKGTATMPARGGRQMQAEEVRKAPDKALLTTNLPNGREVQRGYSGAVAWQAFPGRGVEELTWDDLVRAKQWATFIPGLTMKQDFVREQVVATDKIGEASAYRVMAIRKGGGRVFFDFDAQSGLLLRVSQRIESPLGALPQNTDYSDYRDVNGVKLPFSVTVTQVQGPTIYKWDSIQANVPVEDSRFEKPAQKSAEQ